MNDYTALCDSESCLLTEHKTLSRSHKGIIKEGVKRTATSCPDCGSVLFWMRGPVYDKKKRILKRKVVMSADNKDYGMGII